MKELKPMIHDEKNGLDYILVGDYYIPLIRVAEETRDIGFYGSLRRNYLKAIRLILKIMFLPVMATLAVIRLFVEFL